MAAMMDDYLDSPMDNMDNDDVFPCKGCGEILEEGKAFELAGNRWHLNCFRCNTCGTLLDSDANLLLLGDGSLICNNCTYSCSACNNKIEDLAILTGDQAFCATCFRCRNCKRKIENLRYARTSQGIFCMSCHESLMARRRKKSKAAAQAKAREKDASPMITDKSLPALPPNEIPMGAFSNHRVDPESDTPTELSPRPRPAYNRTDSSSRNSSRQARSPERPAADAPPKESLALPAPNYRNNRNSSILVPSTGGGATDSESFFIPVALDPSPGPTPRSTSHDFDPSKKSSRDKDYFSPTSKSSPSETRTESQSSTPHIAFQEKGRTPSGDHEQKIKPPSRKLSKSSRPDSSKLSISPDDKPPRISTKPSPGGDEFKLQDAPRSKKLLSSRTSSQSSNVMQEAASTRSSNGGLRKERDNLSPADGSPDKGPTPRNSQDSRKRSAEEESRSRADSGVQSRLDASQSKAIPRKELPASASRAGVSSAPVAAPTSRQELTQRSQLNGKQNASAPQSRTASEEPSRPEMDKKVSDTYMQPRQAPAPPAQTVTAKDAKRDGSSPKISPKLPRWSAGGEFSMDEDMARILGTDEGSSSILRRVSNAVRHGRTNSVESSHQQQQHQHQHQHQQQSGRTNHTRSISETTRATASPRWPKTPIAEDPINGHKREISSPISLSSSNQEDPALLKRQLRNSEQRVAELERQFNTEKDLKNLNKKLLEKRKTVSVLDTQTEIMLRQLEVLAGYVERAQETKSPIDPRELEESTIKEFVQKLDKVKQSMAAAIEQLHEERDQLVEEKNQAVADRDRALLEFEQLSSKNAQLADMNNDLTHQIQERFKSHIQIDPKSPLPNINGLGIYPTQRLGSTSSGMDGASINTSTTMVANDQEEPIVESGPTLVNIRKGQVKKFNWKKGSKTIAQNVTKGVNRAVVAFQQERERERAQHQGLTGDNIGMPYNMTVTQVESPSAHGPNGQSMRQASERQGFGFFGKGKTNTMTKSMSMNNASTPTLAEPPSTLFGSELAERADYEHRQIPSVVTRCIEEVERRGMDMEGIYRKTGGNSQVKMIQEGFEKDDGFSVSDESIDITAVTSVLKQYFRKLPTPLLTFDVYERILESNAIASETERCAHLQKTFASMPQRHWDTLEYLMIHLGRIAQQESENLMSPKNLAVVFAPTIMRDTSLEREMTDMHAKNIAIQFVIENIDNIFVD